MNGLDLRRAAHKFRANQPPNALGVSPNTIAKFGYVVIFKDAIVGWISDLDTPSTFHPGAFAIPADQGPIYMAAGGDKQAGAKIWMRSSLL